jgi:hypothetical protein
MAKMTPPKPTHRKRSPFYWWRRFPTHKPLHHYQPLIARIQNGDFDYPEYFEQAKWELQWCQEEIDSREHLFRDKQEFLKEKGDIERRYYKRYGKLFQDGIDAEKKRLDELIKGLKQTFGGTKEEIWDFMGEFDGTLEELHWAYAKHRGINKPNNDASSAVMDIFLAEQAKKRGRGRPPKNPSLHQDDSPI